ncbi:hypothetical protein [Nostoc sp. NMS8]|uniref:hypothetical protein n=1 Tax=Nostoc sp. NMS8 TaxID=2815392 RepID=UPI0025FA73F0|nr:hypothetical protein [Nostoc sp. NMS8]MBN3957330.1 hypothetical protein [Nostoc sp. NMS8]
MPNFNSEPIPELRNPQQTFHSGDLNLRIEGEVVPVVDVHLGQQQSIYFGLSRWLVLSSAPLS